MLGKLKRFIKKFIIKHPFGKKTIVFESRPVFSDNTKAVYDEMVRRGLDKKYKFVWVLFKEDKPDKQLKSVKTVKYNELKNFLYMSKAKALICCNHFVLPAEGTNPFAIYLGHGSPLKNTKDYYVFSNEFDCFLCSSEGMRKIRNEFYGYSLDKLVTLGYPRNDILTKANLNLKDYFKGDFDKFIVWYPTFRQGIGGLKTGAEHALPIIWNEEKALELNEFAKENRVLIVLKPHFAQDLSYVKKLDLSNIVFIDDGFFKEKVITSYEFVGSCDALLTDFSSIYYDYTLCDKPIGLIWEDYEEYKEKPGFAVDMDYMMKGGEKIYVLEDFKTFVKHVADGEDVLKTERREIRDFANISTDGKNAQRVVDYIVEKAGL